MHDGLRGTTNMESKLGDRPNVPLRFASLTWSKKLLSDATHAFGSRNGLARRRL